MDEFTDALMALIEAKTKRDKAFADCDSSWGYHGYQLDEALEKAQERFKIAFRDVMMNLPTPRNQKEFNPPSRRKDKDYGTRKR